MKLIKLSLMVFALSALSLTARSQTNTWNVKAGVNLSSFGNMSNGYKLGYQVGVGMEHSFTKIWSLQPSLLFITKGNKSTTEYLNKYDDPSKTGPVDKSFRDDARSMYLQVPVMAAARFELAKNFNIVLSAGPYVAIGVGGKTHGTEIVSGKKYSSSFFSNLSSRTDLGVGTGIAFELSRFSLGVNGEWGFAKTNSSRITNRTYSLSLGYRF